MKFSKIFMVLAGPALILAASCNETQELDYDIVPGNALYAPEDGTEIDLTTGVTTTFEWAPSIAEDNGYVGYEVLIDKENGDFSNPVATLASSLTGSSTTLSVSATDLNIVASNAGIEAAGTGTLKWTVRASKGIGGSVYSQVNRFTVIRQNSMVPLPESVTIMGSATEDTQNGIPMVVSQGIDDTPALEGTFECFTKLTSGEFTVVDNLNRYYSLNSDGTMTYSETPVSNQVPDGDAIYWLTLTFDGMVWSYGKVSRIEFYGAAWADNSMSTARQELVYEGKGVWYLEDYENTVSVNSANDTRHRFNMYLEDGGEYGIGIVSGQGLGSEYTTDYLKAHIYTKDPTNKIWNWDWDKTWNFLSGDCGVPFDCRLYLNADNEAGAYWHEYYFQR